MKILMLSTDRKIFDSGSAVRERMMKYATAVDELLIAVLGLQRSEDKQGNLRIFGLTRFRALLWRPKEKFDLVTSQDPFETGVIAWRLARRLGAKLELQIHTDIGSPYFWRESIKNKIRFLLAKFLLPKADQIRVVSKRIRDFLISNFQFPISKIIVKPIFIEVEKIKKTPITVDLHQKYSQFEKIILMASRLTREKNIGLAIEAIREIIKSKPRTGLVIVGSGQESEKLKAKSAKLNLEKNVIFEPWIDQETLYSYYKTADLFLVTSLYEGYGMTLVEALAAGCPIVSTDIGVAREMGARIVEYNPIKIAQTIYEK